jgi:hypothetical protein
MIAVAVIAPNTRAAWRDAVKIRQLEHNSNWMYHLARDLLGCDPDLHHLNTTTIRDSSSRYYQMIYVEFYKTPKAEAAETVLVNENHYATWALHERSIIYRPVAIISYDEESPKCPRSELTMEELEHIFLRRDRAHIVEALPGRAAQPTTLDASVAEIEKALATSPQWGEREIFGEDGYNIIAWKVPQGSSLGTEDNWIASRIMHRRVTGVWRFTMRRVLGYHYDLTTEEIIMLSEVCCGTSDVEQLTEDEMKRKSRMPFCTRHHVLRARIADLEALCASCNKRPDSTKWCEGCYRMRYCNAACQTAHWSSHKSDCMRAGEHPASVQKTTAAQ